MIYFMRSLAGLIVLTLMVSACTQPVVRNRYDDYLTANPKVSQTLVVPAPLNKPTVVSYYPLPSQAASAKKSTSLLPPTMLNEGK